jgi:hypothetical protein
VVQQVDLPEAQLSPGVDHRTKNVAIVANGIGLVAIAVDDPERRARDEGGLRGVRHAGNGDGRGKGVGLFGERLPDRRRAHRETHEIDAVWIDRLRRLQVIDQGERGVERRRTCRHAPIVAGFTGIDRRTRRHLRREHERRKRSTGVVARPRQRQPRQVRGVVRANLARAMKDDDERGAGRGEGFQQSIRQPDAVRRLERRPLESIGQRGRDGVAIATRLVEHARFGRRDQPIGAIVIPS